MPSNLTFLFPKLESKRATAALLALPERQRRALTRVFAWTDLMKGPLPAKLHKPGQADDVTQATVILSLAALSACYEGLGPTAGLRSCSKVFGRAFPRDLVRSIRANLLQHGMLVVDGHRLVLTDRGRKQVTAMPTVNAVR